MAAQPTVAQAAVIAAIRKDHPELFAIRFFYLNGAMLGFDWRPRGGWGVSSVEMTEGVKVVYFYNLD
jgi:hypothetical protein